MLDLILIGCAIGAVATLAMDVWALLLNRVAGLPMPNWGNVGRWFWHLRTGRVFHDDIATAAPHPRETAIGWAAHYAVGVIYGAVFALIAGPVWVATPSFGAAWIFGMITIGAGWFLLQPGMGLGWAASKTPNPWKSRAMNVAAHSVFALGLWGGALALG
ncbi:DUF2938 domain-containing protein [Thalassovita aquimarina]|uniref:DUF2938 domain-containing protein n=1 Tax=Thalassovita aquimarina TaxID=2785917 RepID=A0ABS5HX24_9RHOB|nr:DUF2938 domain-containing protein [Thalassovita aquimarina]MBR9653317.1 DUF2938 domain-containing protein [Thalassovita aquimarina]